MKRIDVLAKSATACAVLMLVAACGGGGSGGYAGAPGTGAQSQPSVNLSGTAATGAALADATVTVKCANATGTATTNASGAYSLKLDGGALPCMIEVAGQQGGVAVKLHSLAEAGSTDAATRATSAVANLTPLTEMIVAHLSASLPSDLFAAFGNGSTVSTEQLVAATNAVLSALKDAIGIDLGTIDPFKAQLVAATTNAPGSGNDYDKRLDELGAVVSIEALPQVVNQIASAAGSAGGTTLGEVMQAAKKGPLAGCPVALSGKYRMVDHYGRTNAGNLDFRTMTYKSDDGTMSLAITADSAKPCEFAAEGTRGATSVHYDFAMGSAGVGLYRYLNLSVTPPRPSVGYLFPVQSHDKAELVGEWTMLRSGFVPAKTSYTGFGHWPGAITVGADDSIHMCDQDGCLDNVLTARNDGGFDFNGHPLTPQFFGYRSPSGELNLFGTTNPDGINIDTNDQSHFILTKQTVQAVPAVGTVSKYFDLTFTREFTIDGTGTTGTWANVAPTAPVPDATKIIDVTNNGFADLVTRERVSDKRVETLTYNYPMPGVHAGAASPVDSPSLEIYQFTVPGSGVVVSFNPQPIGLPGGAPGSTLVGYVYAPSVERN